MGKYLRLIAPVLLAAWACTAPQKDYTGVLTDALDDSAWEVSEWISAKDAPVSDGKGFRAADGSSWFVAPVKNDSEVVSAKWMTTGLGVFQIYLNGVPVGEEVLRPGFTHYEKTKYSFTYDITEDYLKGEGEENVLSACLTPGWWGDRIITRWGHEGSMVGRKCAFRAVLELRFKDGSVRLFGTDTGHWKAGIAGPVKHAGIYDGEEYDARVLPGYATPELLDTPEINTEFSGNIFPSAGAEIYHREDLALKPVRAYVWEGVEGAVASEEKDSVQYGKVIVKREYSDGSIMTLSPGETLVVDFGQNAAAVPSFEFNAAEGTVLTCLPSEILNDGNGAESRGMDGPEGSTHRRNLRMPDDCARLTYTFAASGDYVSYKPMCSFWGYRYVSLTADGEVSIKSIRSIPVSSVTAEMESGFITTGNELVNRLISNTIWGQRSNYLSVPTDCPQRDERLGWAADTQVFTETGAFFANTARFFHKWMRDMRDTQSESGSFPGVAPIAMGGEGGMRLGWCDAGVIVPWVIWKHFGDKEIVEENWDAMERYMAHVAETRFDHTANRSENSNYQWADWLSYEALEDCSGGAFQPDGEPWPETIRYWSYLGASYWAIDAGMMRDMAEATGREEDALRYAAMNGEARDYLRSEFLDEEGNFVVPVLNTMQTPALFALKNRLVEGEARDALIARLRENFAGHGNCLQTGFLGTSILMSVLTENGMTDIAYELLFQRKNPSWLYSVDNGATTIWERWNSYMVDKGMGPRGMNSFNHYAYGCVCQWIWETAAGIAADPAGPGFKRIVMKPVPDKRLGHVEAEYHSVSGLIRSAWKYEGDKWIWEFTVPEGSVAVVTLPGESSSEEYSAGNYRIER